MMKHMLRGKKGFIIDCDGVLYHGATILPGAMEFLRFLQEEKLSYVFLTNAATKSQEELKRKFDVKFAPLKFEDNMFYTSALSTAKFISKQKPKASAFVLGDKALVASLKSVGVDVHTVNVSSKETPDYVVVGETQDDSIFNYSNVSKACEHVLNGSKLLGTNPDKADRIGDTLVPGTGSLASVVEQTTGVECYFLGKPNPLMVDVGLDMLGMSREHCLFVGDRMDTDIKAAVEAEVDSALVLTGVSSVDSVQRFAYDPTIVLANVGDIPAVCRS